MLFFNNPKQSIYFILLAVGLAVAVGCQRNDGRNGVSGTVTLDGQPLADAIVHFHPSPGQKGNSSGATTDAEGCFQIVAEKGLLPGKYAVSFQKWEGTGQTTIDPETRKPVEITVPISFKDDDKLEATITDNGGSNRFEFRLMRKE